MLSQTKLFLKIYLSIKFRLSVQGFLLKRATPPSELINLISRLTPMNCGIDLIRVGGENDGGYVLPNDLVGITECFSPGVSDNVSFEKELLEKFQIESHLADFSVDTPPNNFKPKSFLKKFVGSVNNNERITISDWVSSKSGESQNSDFLLQMDIEGDEYQSIIATPQHILEKFRLIVIEIHGYENWADPEFFKFVKTFFEKLLMSFTITHIHANNCCGVTNLSGVVFPNVFELSLIRNDRIEFKKPIYSLRNSLDRDNVISKPTIEISQYLLSAQYY